jgi:hypothetical protein
MGGQAPGRIRAWKVDQSQEHVRGPRQTDTELDLAVAQLSQVDGLSDG